MPHPIPQHLARLMACSERSVVTATLLALVAFVRKTHSSSVRWHGYPELNARLLSLAQGWGGKEQVSDRAKRLMHGFEAGKGACRGSGIGICIEIDVPAAAQTPACIAASHTTNIHIFNLRNRVWTWWRA